MAPDTHKQTSGSAKPRRRWSQWGLRSLLLLVTLIAVGFGAWHIFARPYQVQADIRQAIEDAGGRYTAQPGPAWLQWILGEDVCQDVTEVDLSHRIFYEDYGFSFGSPQLVEIYIANFAKGAEQVSQALLRQFSQCTRLKQLDLTGQNVTDDIVQSWNELQELETLVLSDTIVHDPRTWPKFPLKKLDLTRTSINDKTVVALGKMVDITSLNLDETAVTDEGLKSLAPLVELEELHVAFTLVTEDSCDLLNSFPKLDLFDADMQPMQPLKRESPISAQGAKSTGDGVSITPNALAIDAARRMVVAINDKQDIAPKLWNLSAAFLDELAGAEHVRYLYLGPYGFAGDEQLESLPQIPNLIQLYLDFTWVSNAALPDVAQCTSLELLSLGDTQITGAGLSELAPLINLTELRLEGLRIRDADLAQLKDLPTLEVLDLRGAGITDAGLQHLAELPNLTSVSLSAKGIRGPGLRYLLDHPKMQRVLFDGSAYGRWHAETRLPVPPLSLQEVAYFQELARHLVSNHGSEAMANRRDIYARDLDPSNPPPRKPGEPLRTHPDVPADDVLFEWGLLLSRHELSPEVQALHTDLFRWWKTLQPLNHKW